MFLDFEVDTYIKNSVYVCHICKRVLVRSAINFITHFLLYLQL